MILYLVCPFLPLNFLYSSRVNRKSYILVVSHVQPHVSEKSLGLLRVFTSMFGEAFLKYLIFGTIEGYS